LTYYRIHALPADLPTVAIADKRACVLDLRYATGDSQTAGALDAWLKFHATPRTPVFVLANSGTSAALLVPLATRDSAAGILLLGPEAPGFFPDIAVKTTADEERRAYDALESGAKLESLLTDNPDKPRNDEARLAKDHVPDPGPDDTVDDDPAAPAEKKPPAKITPPIDAVLQRAVHVHRGLLALKKI
jgi:antitoxin (DNA-binding transcriptional repressor) of toxin-antitoxin stability system